MLDYNPSSNLYLVKRVHVPNHVLEAAAGKQETGKGGEKKGQWFQEHAAWTFTQRNFVKVRPDQKCREIYERVRLYLYRSTMLQWMAVRPTQD